MMPYIQGYIIDIEKIQKFLNTSDPNDGRIDDVFCKILDFFDLEEHPMHLCSHDRKTVTVVLLSPDAYASDIKTLEAKNLQPSTFMTQIADALLTGPPY
ncbi:hypothetical protein BYT27DRAFT_7180868, partial [Phlegmacium glaucopus]